MFKYAGEQGYELTLGEGYVGTPRKGSIAKVFLCPKCGTQGTTPITGFFDDKVHMPGSLHYSRLAIDLNLFVEGGYVSDGAHPAFQALGVFWEGLDPLCRWGGRFQDANHFSIANDGKA